MLESTGLGVALRALSYLYWLLAIGALALALWKGNTARSKAVWAALVVVVFGYFPVNVLVAQYRRDAFAKEAWAYFKKQCDEKSGEKIYKTFSGVKSVLIVKPLPPATEKDLYDQYWYGDPYSTSSTNDRGLVHARTLIGNQKFINGRGNIGFAFFEMSDIERTERYVRVEPQLYPPHYRISSTDKPVSRFGISWEDISTPSDRKYWVSGSRLRIVDLSNGALVAERVGYLIEQGFGSTSGQRRPWQTSRFARGTTCPPVVNGTYEDRWFILQALKPDEGA